MAIHRAALAATLFLAAGSASAAPITASFSVTGFAAGAPTDPVSGTIVWEADSATAPIQSLTSVDLTIDGHAYALAEVGFLWMGGTYLIAGELNGLMNILPGTDDFFLVIDGATPRYLLYSSPGAPSGVLGQTFTSFSVTAGAPRTQLEASVAAVPEPGTLALLGVALGAGAFARRRGRPG